MNMTKVIIGAGMTALPRAWFLCGSLLGTSLLALVYLLTYFTMAVLVDGSATTRAPSYAALTRVTCGRSASLVLQLAVLLFCFGFSVVYLVVIGDILAGTPPLCNGLLCELLGITGGLLADRRAIIAAVALVVCAPLAALRSMDALAPLNAVGIAAIGLLSITAAGVGVAATVRGAAFITPLLPQWRLLGPTPAAAAAAAAGVIPVILSCFVGHQSVHPLMPLMQPYTPARMRACLAVSLALALAVFLILCLGCATAFGPFLAVDVLNNLSVDALTPLVGSAAAAAAAAVAVRVAFLLSLLASLLLYLHPLRSSTAQLLWSGPVEASAAAEARHFYALTYGLLAAALAAAVVVPDVYAALDLIGNVSATIQAFIIPPLISLALLGWGGRWHLGCADATNGTVPPGGADGLGAHTPAGDCDRVIGSRADAVENGGSVGPGALAPPDGGGAWQRRAHAAASAAVLLLGVALFFNGLIQKLFG